ncbi:MAG: hypothetical protein KatS3mg110_0340 [Pirellulaceae bacterium]|nr:MAG: hypothetical protein KatS3mg110_0340 [Pirellulaceae bacterium]
MELWNRTLAALLGLLLASTIVAVGGGVGTVPMFLRRGKMRMRLWPVA